jgi:hypothetical protein
MSVETLEQWVRIRILCSFRIYAQNFCRSDNLGVMSKSLEGLKIKFGHVLVCKKKFKLGLKFISNTPKERANISLQNDSLIINFY